MIGSTTLALAWILTAPLPALVISEVMYHPREETPGVEDRDQEWIELYNETADPLDLSGYTFTRGIEFAFPQGTFLLGRSYLIVCANQEAVRARYGIMETDSMPLVFPPRVAIGNWAPETGLDNTGETIALANPAGCEVAKVEYNDRNRWPAGADGTGHSLALLDPYIEPDDPDSWDLSPSLLGSPGTSNFGDEAGFRDTVLLQDSAVWSYFKGDVAPPADWNTPGFDDSGWFSGQTGIGYGETGLRTTLNDMRNGYLTIFCRNVFTVSDPSKVDSLILSITYDDGFYMYFNGTEVVSRNVSGRDFDDPAASTKEWVQEEIDLSASKGLLRAGENILAVQVHNRSQDSTDLVFIPKLISRRLLLPEGTTKVPIIINEGLVRTTGERWIELHNISSDTIDLSGYHLTDDKRDLLKATLPAGTAIEGLGRLALTDASLGLNFSLLLPEPRTRVFIALVTPSGTRVVDAYTFKPTTDERSEARVPDGDKEMQPAAPPTRGTSNILDLVGDGDIVLNEILYHPWSGDRDCQFIELHNRGGVPVNLIGFQLSKAVEYEFPSVVLEPGGYLVIARAPATIIGNYDLPAEKVLGPWYRLKFDDDGNSIHEPASLSFSGERVVLLDPYGNVADSVRYRDGGEWPPWADGDGSSLELIDPYAPRSCPQSWDSSDDSAEAEAATFTYTCRNLSGDSELQLFLLDKGIAVVDDISLKKTTTEYLSNGGFEVDAAGWRMEGTHVECGRTTDPALVLSGSGSLKVVATAKGDYKSNHIETYPNISPALENAVNYTVAFKARWVVGARTIHTRGYNSGLARTHYLPVPLTLGTPGAPNSVTLRQQALIGEANMGPVIDKVSHDPVVPGADEDVTVTARVRDPDGVRASSVLLKYALSTPPADASGYTSIAMTGPDADDRYRAVIPGAGRTMGTTVLFFIAAEDASSQNVAGRFPVDHILRTNPLLLDPSNPTMNDCRYAMYRHDVRYPSTPYLSYRFILDDATRDYFWSRPILANDYVRGTFVFGGGKSYYNASIRWGGSPWLRGRSWGNSYRLRFSGDELLHGRVKRINLENHGTDGKERISNHLIRYNNRPGIKVPYSLQWYARWQVNGDANATYEAVERPNNEYISFWFPDDDDGDLFEVDDRFEFNDAGSKISNQDARLTNPPYSNAVYSTRDPADGYISWRENYRWFFTPALDRADDRWSNLIEFSQVLDPAMTSNTDFDELIGGYADLQEMLRVWAVRMNTDDWDSWGTNRGKNCFLYQRPSDGLWTLLPWDMELTYGNTATFPPLGSMNSIFTEVNRILNRPWIRKRFYAILNDMVNGQFNMTFLGPWLDAIEANGTGSLGVGRSGGFIEIRAKNLQNFLHSWVYPQLRLKITTNAGNGFTTPLPEIDLAGEAPVEIERVIVYRMEGAIPVAVSPQPAFEFSRTNMKAWTMVGVPLQDGPNRLFLQGYSISDDPIDSTEIGITKSIVPPPSLSSLEPVSAAPGDPVSVIGSDFQDGIKVYFGTTEAAPVTFDPDDTTRAGVSVPATLAQGSVMVMVRNADGQESNSISFLVRNKFIRGDSNLDGMVEIGDAIRVLTHLFGGDAAGCLEALDANDNLAVDLSDALFLLQFLFMDGLAPAAPYPAAGVDPGATTLGCSRGL
jgi:hypothetical protein